MLVVAVVRDVVAAWRTGTCVLLLALAACGGGEGSVPVAAGVPTKASDPAPASTAVADVRRLPLSLGPSVSVLEDGDFEAGSTVWSATERVITSDNNAHSGRKYAWLGGYDNAFDRVSQIVRIPAGAKTASVQFWYRIATRERSASVYDGMAVSLHDSTSGTHLSTLKLFTNLDATSGWSLSPAYDISAFAGRTVELRFSAITDESDHTSFLVDDVAVSVVDPGPLVSVTAIAGTRDRYEITATPAGFTVRDLQGSEGIRDFSAGERLQFDDVAVALESTGTAAQAYRLYRAAFNRRPDLPGLGFQIAALEESRLPLSQVSENFINSPEFSATYGSLDNARFVAQLYANVLQRAPDPGGLAFHVNRLNAGTVARRDVLIGFSESPENQASVAQAISAGIAFVPLHRSSGQPAPGASVCNAQQVLRGGQCVPNQTSCTAPSVLRDGVCVAPQVTCAPPKVLHAGLCAAPVTSCTAPLVLRDGACVSAPAAPAPRTPPPQCGPNQVARNGVCEGRGYCLPWTLPQNGRTYALREVVSHANGYYACINQQLCNEGNVGPTGRGIGLAWEVSTRLACGRDVPALNGSITVDNIVLGNRSNPVFQGWRYLFGSLSDPSFFPEIMNNTDETLAIVRVCFAGSAPGTTTKHYYNNCHDINDFAPNATYKVPNSVPWAHGEFHITVFRRPDLDPKMQPIVIGEFTAADYGFVPVPWPDVTCVLNGSIRNTNPDCQARFPIPSMPTPREPSAPARPSAPADVPAPSSTGGSAMNCVTSTLTNNVVTFTNNCNRKVFVMYCGDLKYSSSRCGKSKDYFTHAKNMIPGESSRTFDVHLNPAGSYRYGACFGGISFGNDNDFKAYADGSFVCLDPGS